MVRRIRWALCGLLALSCGNRVADPGSLPPSASSVLFDQATPDFDRPTLSGVRFDTQAQRGHVVIVKFFAEYCAPCKRTLPAAESLHQRYPNVAFVGISEDEYERQAKSMVTTYGLSFPVVHDRGNVLAGRFRVNEMPTTFVIDPAGTVRWVGGPAQTEQDLQRAIAFLGGV